MDQDSLWGAGSRRCGFCNCSSAGCGHWQINPSLQPVSTFPQSGKGFGEVRFWTRCWTHLPKICIFCLQLQFYLYLKDLLVFNTTQRRTHTRTRTRACTPSTCSAAVGHRQYWGSHWVNASCVRACVRACRGYFALPSHLPGYLLACSYKHRAIPWRTLTSVTHMLFLYLES